MIKQGFRTIFLALSILFFGTSMALAFSCPVNIAAFDKAMAAGPNVSQETVKQATELRVKAEQQHKAGNHGGSIESINQALDLIGAE